MEALAGEAAAQHVTPLHRRATSWPVTLAHRPHPSENVVVPGRDVLLPLDSPFDASLGSAESSWVSTVTVSPCSVPAKCLVCCMLPDTHRQIVASGDSRGTFKFVQNQLCPQHSAHGPVQTFGLLECKRSQSLRCW